MHNLKLKFLLLSIITTGTVNAITIDFDSASYAIPVGQIAANANGVDGWESQDFLGFVVPEPGIGSAQALGFGPKYVLPNSASETISRDVNLALIGNGSGSTNANFYADFIINAPENAPGRDVFGISLYGNAGGESVGFTFDAGNTVDGLGGDLGIGGVSNIYYNSKYNFHVSFTGSLGDLRTYAATITDVFGGSSQTLNGTLTSTELSSFGLTYSLADSTADLETASDAYIILDNVSFTVVPEPSVTMLSLFGIGLLIVRRHR